MNVRITREARLDLEMIGNWIAEDNPDRAITFVDELLERCRSLADHPRRFPVIAQIDGEDVHKLSHRGYLILYFVFNDAVEVTHVVHGARDVEAMIKASDQ